MSTILTFENTEFDVVDIHQVAWLRLPQIGVALGYESHYKLQQLYARNADEFTAEMTQVLDLPTAGGVQPVRIFSPRGCYLLGMLSRTEKAKAFRQWVLDVLEGRTVPQQVGHMSHGQRLAYLKSGAACCANCWPKRRPGCAARCMISCATSRACWPCPAPPWTPLAARFSRSNCRACKSSVRCLEVRISASVTNPA